MTVGNGTFIVAPHIYYQVYFAVLTYLCLHNLHHSKVKDVRTRVWFPLEQMCLRIRDVYVKIVSFFRK